MTLPNFTADESLYMASGRYRMVGNGATSSRGDIVLAAGCAGVDCNWAQTFCFASLDLDPFSCGLYYTCCQGAGTTMGSDCRANPCDPGCPTDLCIRSMQSARGSSGSGVPSGPPGWRYHSARG